MLSASHWLLAQAWFCERTHLPLSPNSTTPTVQVIFRYLRPDTPVFKIHRIPSNCGHGDISAILLLILSLSGCSYVNILWYTCRHDDISVITPVLSIYLSTTSAVFTPAGHVNILQEFIHSYAASKDKDYLRKEETKPHCHSFCCNFISGTKNNKAILFGSISVKKAFALHRFYELSCEERAHFLLCC